MAGIDFIHQNGVDYEIVPEIAPRFKTTINYAAGDCVIYNAEAYRFKTAHSAGAWIGTDAEKFLVGEELGAIKEDLNIVSDGLDAISYASWRSNIRTVTPTITQGLTNADGTVSASVSYYYTEIIPVTSGDFVRYIRNNADAFMRSIVAYSDGVAVEEKASTGESVKYFTIPSEINGIVINFFSVSSDGSVVVDSPHKELETAFDARMEQFFTKTSVSASATSSGYKLTKYGSVVSDASYQLKKYPVTAGKTYKITFDAGMAQFQDSASVAQSIQGVTHRLGGTYEAGGYVLTAPVSATYLILSVPTSGTFSCMIMDNELSEMLTENGESWEV